MRLSPLFSLPGTVSTILYGVPASDPAPEVSFGQTDMNSLSAPMPALVSAIFGMGYVADAGYGGSRGTYGTSVTPPQTPFAAGNDPSSLPAFTSVKILGADAVFGSDNVAPMIPVTESSRTVGYATKDVSAGANAPGNASNAVDWSEPDWIFDDELIPCSAGVPETRTLHLSVRDGDKTKIVVLKDASVQPADGGVKIAYFPDGSDAQRTFEMSIEQVNRQFDDSDERQWVKRQGELAIEQPPPDKAQAAEAAEHLKNRVEQEISDHRAGGAHGAANDGMRGGVKFGRGIQSKIAIIGEAATAVGAGVQVLGLETLGGLQFAFDTVHESAEFVGRLTNAPFTTTYQTVVKLGQSVCTVVANPSIVGKGMLDIVSTLYGPNVSPVEKGRLAASIFFALATPGGAEAEAAELNTVREALKVSEAKALEVAETVVAKDGRVIMVNGKNVRIVEASRLSEAEREAIARSMVEDIEETTIALRDHCFAAGTPVLTPSGQKRIEQFKKGDEILSRPEDSPDAPARTSYVEEVFELSGDTLVLSAGGRTITTTEKHPFYVVGKGWVRALELEPGDLLLGHDGTTTAVESAVSTGKQERVYNLRVAFDRTYFVGSRAWDFSVWVHNTYSVPDLPNADGKWEVISKQPGRSDTVVETCTTKKEAQDAARRLTQKNAAANPYVQFNHTHSGAQPVPRGLGPNGGRLQSHHGLQDEWAVHNIPGYDPGLAPTITLETGRGFPHATISGLQNARRDARIASKLGKWSSTIDEELEYIVSDFRAAGFDDNIIRQVLQQQYNMLDRLKVKYNHPSGF